MSASASYFCYWGKFSDNGRYHLLPYHCLDVAAVVATWWGSSSTVRRSYRSGRSCTEEQFRGWLLFFTALHDYGKFDLRFQRKVPSVWGRLFPLSEQEGALPSPVQINSYQHGEGGLYWFKNDYCARWQTETNNDKLFRDESEPEHWQDWKPWIEAVTGHHGCVKQVEYVADAPLSVMVDRHFSVFDKGSRIEWLTALEKLFLRPVGLSLDDFPQPPPSTMLAGLCSVADWLGSRCDELLFPFQESPGSLDDYFARKLNNDAPAVFEASGINRTAKAYGGVAELLKSSDSPRPLQTKVDNLPLKPGLTIIEAPTGSGKTEAALAYAWRLLATGLADSIIFALPTQATANAMLGRLEKVSSKVFADSPNLLLAHGNARFNRDFVKLKHRGYSDEANPDGWAQCGAWLAESRKRVFLGQIGVCTVDQVLISVLPVKHRFVRGLGLGRSVLIVDEVHAYDAYMYGLLEEVLKQQYHAGGSSILLSATLPATQRERLCAAWGDNSQTTSMDYPLLTWVGPSPMKPLTLEAHEQLESVTVSLEPLRLDGMKPDQALFTRLIAAAEDGAQVAVICNLVNDAQRLAATLRTMTMLPVDLFHSRFRFKDRQIKEENVIRCFGPDGSRQQGRILVATQVVEQSLDIDFDWLITQLCPVDLLFQRMGRLHRHRLNRPSRFEQPLCTILLPSDGGYGYTGKIYAATRVLWRTEQLLLSSDSRAIFPKVYRDWIERVYQDEIWENEPAEITQAYEKYRDEEFVARCKALQQICSAANPFSDTDEKVTALTRDGEMGLTVIPFVHSSAGRRLLDDENVAALDDFSRAEILVLNSISVPARWRGWMENLCDKDEEGRFWLAMPEKGAGCYMSEGEKVTFRYRRDTGLERVT